MPPTTAPSGSRERSTDAGRREAVATRLLRSSQRRSFDPLVEVDWDAPHDPGLAYAPDRRQPLYGTALWDRMTPEQRRDLGRHQVSSIAAAGIWFEIVLMRLLLRHAYWLDPTQAHTQYAMTETGDECRHTVMFAKLVSWLDTPTYGPGARTRWLGNAFVSPLSNHALAFAGALYVEDVLDRLQREAMDDPGIQPVVRQVSRIHVIEEARHLGFARDELPRQLATMGRLDLARTRALLPVVVALTTDALVHPRMYREVGLDVGEALAAQAASEPWRETLRWCAADSLAYFRELGLVDGVAGRRLWARTPL